jgi:hypothetical protein
MKAVSVLTVLALAVPAMAMNITVQMDGSDPTGSIYHYDGAMPISFESEDGDGFVRKYQKQSWNYPFLGVDLTKVTGGEVDMSGGITLQFTGRYFQDAATNTNPYQDAPIGVFLVDADNNTYGLGWMYQASGYPAEERYPAWKTVSKEVDFGVAGEWPSSESFDATKVVAVRFLSTDWFTLPSDDPGYAGPYDYIDLKNLVITPEPASLAFLALGGLGLLRRRR